MWKKFVKTVISRIKLLPGFFYRIPLWSVHVQRWGRTPKGNPYVFFSFSGCFCPICWILFALSSFHYLLQLPVQCTVGTVLVVLSNWISIPSGQIHPKYSLGTLSVSVMYFHSLEKPVDCVMSYLFVYLWVSEEKLGSNNIILDYRILLTVCFFSKSQSF